MKMSKKYRWFFIGIFTLSLILRLFLAIVNREANDDHMIVIRMIMETGRLPVMFECRECFHPKLFYITGAALIKLLGVSSLGSQIFVVQMLNFAAGAFTLWVIYKFINEYPAGNDYIKLVTFALIALNPKFIAINSQASNDSFVILFCTSALYWSYRFLQFRHKFAYWLMISFILMALSSKVIGIVVFLAICVGFLLDFWAGGETTGKKLTNITVLIITIILGTVLNPLSQVVTNVQKFNSPFAFSEEKLPLPHIFQQTTYYENQMFRPGITSIQDGFFTFKLGELLKYPLINNETDKYPPHRTSFWTMLYADSHSLHFQNWPISWQTTDSENFTISRIIFILALLPTIILLLGLFIEVFAFFKFLFTGNKPGIRNLSNGVFLFTCGGYIAFLMLITLLYRDFSYIKMAYILPGILAFTWIFLRGYGYVFHKLISIRFWGIGLLHGWLIILMVFYTLDVSALISHFY